MLQETDQPLLADRIEEASEVRVKNIVHLCAGGPPASAAGETQADVARTYAVDAATISRLAAASPFEQGAVGDLR